MLEVHKASSRAFATAARLVHLVQHLSRQVDHLAARNQQCAHWGRHPPPLHPLVRTSPPAMQRWCPSLPLDCYQHRIHAFRGSKHLLQALQVGSGRGVGGVFVGGAAQQSAQHTRTHTQQIPNTQHILHTQYINTHNMHIHKQYVLVHTGRTGRRVVSRLVDEGVPVRALVRNAIKAVCACVCVLMCTWGCTVVGITT